MEMPEIKIPDAVRKVGLTDRTRRVYIEDYVLQYLKLVKQESAGDKEIFLYGSRQICAGVEIYIIYGACENISVRTDAYSNNSNGNKISFSEQEMAGCLNMEIWRGAEDEYSGIILGNPIGGQPIEGYYTYYDADERMEEYLGSCLKRSLDFKKKESVEEVNSESNKKGFQAELVAQSREKGENIVSLYAGIRIAVVCIFIILCTIAVTTINSYEKMQYFIKAVVSTNEIIEQR